MDPRLQNAAAQTHADSPLRPFKDRHHGRQPCSRRNPRTDSSLIKSEIARRDGGFIPEQEPDPEDPKRAVCILAVDRGSLVFLPERGFTHNVAELTFDSQFPIIMARFNISPETVNCP